MPRPPGGQSDTPLHHCPKCHEVLTFHNERTEPDASGTLKTVTVFLCRQHGFFHVRNGEPLAVGM